jgi:hypothetical protein
MTIDRARQLLKSRPILAASTTQFGQADSEVQREHGQVAVDGLIRELALEAVFGFQPGTRFEGGLALGREY